MRNTFASSGVDADFQRGETPMEQAWPAITFGFIAGQTAAASGAA